MRKSFRSTYLDTSLAFVAVVLLAILTACPTSPVHVSGVSLDKSAASVDIGYTEQLTATVSPAEAGNKNVAWSSSNEAVANVSSTGLVTIVAGLVGGETATITVSTVDGGFTAKCDVTAVFQSVSGLIVNPATAGIGPGATRQLQAVFTPEHATNKTIVWTSDNESVATVSSSGLVTVSALAITGQTATITATTQNGGLIATCAVTVVVPVTGVNLNLSSTNVEIGATQQLTANIQPAGATNANVSWSTSDAARATVSATGLVTGVSDGDVTITVTTQDGTFTATCLVTVLPTLYRTFNSINCTNDAVYAVPSTRRAVGTHSIVYVENAQLANVSEATAAAVCAEFDADIYNMMRTNFANESDVDGNGKAIFLLQDIIDGYSGSGGYVAGFFNPTNEFDSSSEPNSNEADMLFMDVNPATVGSPTFYGTMAHEFQHLINFTNTYMVTGTEQDIWINEGLSSGAEYLYAGAQVASRISYFNSDPLSTIRNGNNFFLWNGYWEEPAHGGDVLADYSTVYLFFQWLQLHASNGTAIYKDILSSSYRDYRCVTSAASARIGSSYSSWEVLLRTWMLSNLLCSSSGSYGYMGQISVAAKYFSSTGGATCYLSRGEGIFSMTSGGTYTPAAGSGANIRYVGISGAGAIDTASPYTGIIVLTFNANSSSSAADEVGFLANEVGVASVMGSLNSVTSVAPDLTSYPIDVSFGTNGKLAPNSHRPPNAKRPSVTPDFNKSKKAKW
jgi:uncharacterized protein YjdB